MDLSIQPHGTPKKEFSVLAGYDVGPVIGIGTYGEVRCARHRATGKRVAIKIVDLSRFEEEARQLIMKEIHILRICDHGNIIRLLEVKEAVVYKGKFCNRCACTQYESSPGSGGCVSCGPHTGADHSGDEVRQVMFLVEELAAGGEIFGLLMHGGPLPEDVARLYFQQLMAGVEYLHNRGIAHRDLKPENLVLDAHFRLKIVDFGLAASFNDDAGHRKVLHAPVGSQPYSAPEVYYSKELFNNRGYQGPPSDLWSCAVILFVMLTGRPPFVRPLARSFGHLRRCKHFVNLLKGKGYGDMSASAQSLLQRMLQSDPDDRLTIEQIRNSEWFNGPVPEDETLAKIMEERSHSVWLSQENYKMVEVLTKQRNHLEQTPMLGPAESRDHIAEMCLADAERREFGVVSASPALRREPTDPESVVPVLNSPCTHTLQGADVDGSDGDALSPCPPQKRGATSHLDQRSMMLGLATSDPSSPAHRSPHVSSSEDRRHAEDASMTGSEATDIVSDTRTICDGQYDESAEPEPVPSPASLPGVPAEERLSEMDDTEMNDAEATVTGKNFGRSNVSGRGGFGRSGSQARGQPGVKAQLAFAPIAASRGVTASVGESVTRLLSLASSLGMKVNVDSPSSQVTLSGIQNAARFSCVVSLRAVSLAPSDRPEQRPLKSLVISLKAGSLSAFEKFSEDIASHLDLQRRLS